MCATFWYNLIQICCQVQSPSFNFKIFYIEWKKNYELDKDLCDKHWIVPINLWLGWSFGIPLLQAFLLSPDSTYESRKKVKDWSGSMC